MKKESIIEVRGATFTYVSSTDKTVAVDAVDFNVYKGEFLVILGHNGSGKSTLAKLFNGFLLPDSGTVSVDGILTTEEKRIFEIRRKIGMVFQNPDNQTVASIVEDDIAFGPENLGVPREEIIERVEWALSAVNMSEYRNSSPHKLSGGQKQRIALAAVLAMMPDILVLDESTSMLDPQGRAEVLESLRALNEKGMTVVLITHYMDEAIHADRVCIMSESKIIAEGTPVEVFSNAAAVTSSKLDLPVAAKVSFGLQKAGFDIKLCLTDEELADEIGALTHSGQGESNNAN